MEGKKTRYLITNYRKEINQDPIVFLILYNLKDVKECLIGIFYIIPCNNFVIFYIDTKFVLWNSNSCTKDTRSIIFYKLLTICLGIKHVRSLKFVILKKFQM